MTPSIRNKQGIYQITYQVPKTGQWHTHKTLNYSTLVLICDMLEELGRSYRFKAAGNSQVYTYEA